jgi:TPR repeat protein
MIADARADLATAGRAFEAEDYGTAYRAYDPLARAGDVEAQYWMGHSLDGTYCGKEDPEHASVCLLKAAKQGHEAAQQMIGAYHARAVAVCFMILESAPAPSKPRRPPSRGHF